jgi:hypothetical protein
MVGDLLALSSFWVVATTLGNSWIAGRNFSCKSQTLGSISTTIDGWDENGIQQGGVRYRAVSHGRTRMLLGSPIRFCVIVEEDGLRTGLERCWGIRDGAARRRRDALMLLSGL